MKNTLQMLTLGLFLVFINLYRINGLEEETASNEEYCLQKECFQPRCRDNEVIMIKSATYGRMRIGKCITAEEVDAQRSIFGNDPRYLGCSADVLPRLDQKCSGKVMCEVCVYDFSDENIQPCFPGLKMYLEVSYDCINVVDEQRSCDVTVARNPIHVLGTTGTQKICGTKSKPWNIEAPAGQKIDISIFDFPSTVSEPARANMPCHGVIVDRDSNRNVTICGNNRQRQRQLYLSSGNKVNIFLNPMESEENVGKFLLKLGAVGCSDIIPPEDTWLKRNGDQIMIGCYSSRQTWQFNCQDGKWIGALGNCSQHSSKEDPIPESQQKPLLSDKSQVLAIVAIVGFTMSVCLAIICIGIVCLRRFHMRSKKKQHYNTLNYSMNSATNQRSGQTLMSSGANDSVSKTAAAPPYMPTYSVFVGESDVNDIGLSNERR